ncbi:MAG TPA: DPP IV N-terminal domain-containing protein [Herpetosiphonaceae bacterium]
MRVVLLLLLAGVTVGTTLAQAPADQALDQKTIYAPLVGTGGPGRIAYVNDDTAGWSIHVVNGDGTGDVAITDFPLTTPDNPSWSPSGTRLAFDAPGAGSSLRQIYVMQDDGSDIQQITNDPGGASDPSWSPDGSAIAFVSARDGNQEIYVMNANGSNQVRLTNNSSLDVEPAWSPDGSRIVFTSTRDGNAEIYSMLANGAGLTRLTNDPIQDTSPAWSPNGLWIAFCSQHGGAPGGTTPPDLFVMSSNGSGAVNLTNTAEYVDCGPTWSPDSTRIVFTRGTIPPTPTSSTLYSVGVDGTSYGFLAGSFRYNFSPAWSR